MRLGRAWTNLATKRLGPFARIVPPLVLLAIVFLPLQRAVGEITHRSQIRVAVSDLLSGDKRKVVQYTLDQTASAIILRVVVVGNAHTASELERHLKDRLARLDVAAPRISIWAVPDAASVTALSHRLDEMPPPVVPEPAPQMAHRYSAELATAIRAVWPSYATGELVDLWMDLDRPDHVRLTHLGAPIGPAGVQLLARTLEPAMGKLEIVENAMLPIENVPETRFAGYRPRSSSCSARGEAACNRASRYRRRLSISGGATSNQDACVYARTRARRYRCRRSDTAA